MPRHLISGAHEWINSLVVRGLFTLVNPPWTTRSSPFPWGESFLGIEVSGEWEDTTGVQSRRSVI